MNIKVVHNITKVYPDMIKVVIYKEPKVYLSNEHISKRSKEDITEDYTPTISSLNRTKTNVKDIVLCNDFDLFCTFTFNPDKVDRFNFYECQSKMRVWLHHQSDNSKLLGKSFKYLVIPEQHKSGAWHFHALISGYTGSLKASGLKTYTLRDIYNITSFRSGFTTAVAIDDRESVANYVTKYITKSFVTHFNQRRFFCSRNLTRPTRTINSSIFKRTPPIFRFLVSDSGQTEQYILPPL